MLPVLTNSWPSQTQTNNTMENHRTGGFFCPVALREPLQLGPRAFLLRWQLVLGFFTCSANSFEKRTSSLLYDEKKDVFSSSQCE